jgi:hypothetical protein
MLVHQLAAAHKVTMEQLGRVKFDQDGLLTLCTIRQNGNQRITVQYVNVSNGSQAILGDVVKSQEQSH